MVSFWPDQDCVTCWESPEICWPFTAVSTSNKIRQEELNSSTYWTQWFYRHASVVALLFCPCGQPEAILSIDIGQITYPAPAPVCCPCNRVTPRSLTQDHATGYCVRPESIACWTRTSVHTAWGAHSAVLHARPPAGRCAARMASPTRARVTCRRPHVTRARPSRSPTGAAANVSTNHLLHRHQQSLTLGRRLPHDPSFRFLPGCSTSWFCNEYRRFGGA
jgi:hypothetical protein